MTPLDNSDNADIPGDGNAVPGNENPKATGRRRRFTRARTALMYAVLAANLYLLSVGPASWLYDHTASPALHTMIRFTYWPVVAMAEHGPEPLSRIINDYGAVWSGL